MKPTAAETIHAQRNALRRETSAMFAAVRMPPKGATVASEARRLRRLALSSFPSVKVPVAVSASPPAPC